MKYWLLTLVAFSLAACSPHSKQDINIDGPIWIQVPITSGEKYTLSPVQIFTLKNLKNLSGLAARFFVNPSVQGTELLGRSPDFNYIRGTNDVIVPSDALSLQLASVYVNMEKLRDLDKAAGAENVNTWPRKVAVNAIYSTPGEGRLYNNALYSGLIDAMVFVPYTQNDLPVMVNAGVIGHEHFHSLFYKLVVLPLGVKYPEGQKVTIHDEKSRLSEIGVDNDEPVPNVDESERDVYHAVLLRGINEGLADVWGWIYSNDVDFVHRSIPQEKITRRIDLPIGRLSSTAEVKSNVNLYADSGEAAGISYSLGNQLARAIKGLSETRARSLSIDDKTSRLQMAVTLVKSLKLLKVKIESLKENELLSPADILEMVASDWSKDSSLNIELCTDLVKLTPKQDEAQLTSCQKVLEKP